MKEPRAYVDFREFGGSEDGSRVHLRVVYEDKEAWIDLPAGLPAYPGERANEHYRRELIDLFAALQVIAASDQGIE